MKQNYDCCACKCSFLQTYFSVLCWSVPPCKCNIAMVDLSLMPANQLRRHLGVRFFSTLYYVWPGFGVFGGKNIGYELICCSFLCHDTMNFVFFFNAILNCLYPIQAHCNCFLPTSTKTQSSSTKQTLVKVLG